MVHNASHCVWIWTDKQNQPKFVGWGTFEGAHPAKKIWARRNAFSSELNRWLVQLEQEPNRKQLYPIVLMSKIEARAMAKAYTKKLKQADYAILDNRPQGTKIGGGANREVLGPDLEVYNSVRHAAAEVGVNASTITRWCQQVDTRWDYLPPKEETK